jgi:hypothetical protein
MRINFAGSLTKLKPIVLVYDADAIFSKADYVTLGYTVFEVICIAGGGGRGGNYFGEDFNDSSKTLKVYGGMGGGGGYHRIKGTLAALPSSTNIVVGGAGTQGTDLLTDSTDEYDISTTDGGDGGNSHFNNPTCIASGGKGGKRVYSATLDIDPNCSGGDGGSGASSAAGGGGLGAVAGTLTVPPELPGVGTLLGGVGKGGGGGAGGLGLTAPSITTRIEATNGEKGSYNSVDQSVFDVGGSVSLDTGLLIVPGWGGGARTTPLNGSNLVYGRSGAPGAVVLRLTVD